MPAGSVIGLSGPLGAGKTELVRGLARGLGYAGRVHSPTFNLVNEYLGGRLPLFHLDLYRLDGPAQIVEAGLEEYLRQPTGLIAIEWVERWSSAAPPPWTGKAYRQVRIESPGEFARRIFYEDFGP